MSRGQHAADDGSFPRSAGGAMARGIGLILVAVVLGVVLLRATDSPEPFTPVASGDDQTQTTEPADAGNGDEPAGDDTTTTTTAPAHNPSEVGVLVANGTGGVKGAAGTISDVLKSANYQVKPPTNTAPAEASVVYYLPGYEADAKAVAALLTPQPSVQPMPDQRPVEDLAGAHILVVVAADLVSG